MEEISGFVVIVKETTNTKMGERTKIKLNK